MLFRKECFGGTPKPTREARALPLRNPNRFRVCEFANAGSAKLAAKAGTFYAAERQTRIGCDQRVDENHSSLQFRREKFLLGGIVCPRARREAECGVVCELDRLGCVAHAKNRRDRTENFFAVSRRFFWYIDKNSWLVKKSRAMNPISARQQFCTICDR